MTALATLAPPRSPPVPARDLAQNLASFDGMQIIRGQVPAEIVEQAKAHLAALERYHAPPPPARIEVWCRELRKGLAPITDQEFADRLAAIQADFGKFPGWVWNSETLSLMRRRNRFFPLSCDVEEVFQPIIQAKMRGMAQTRLLAGAKPALANVCQEMDISRERETALSAFR